MDVMSLSEVSLALLFALGAGAVVLGALNRTAEPLRDEMASRIAQSIELEERCKDPSLG